MNKLFLQIIAIFMLTNNFSEPIAHYNLGNGYTFGQQAVFRNGEPVYFFEEEINPLGTSFVFFSQDNMQATEINLEVRSDENGLLTQHAVRHFNNGVLTRVYEVRTLIYQGHLQIHGDTAVWARNITQDNDNTITITANDNRELSFDLTTGVLNQTHDESWSLPLPALIIGVIIIVLGVRYYLIKKRRQGT